MLWIRSGMLDLLRNKGFAFFFILNLSLGLAGFIAIHSFGISLNQHIRNNLKEILTADIAISGNRALGETDHEIIRRVIGIKAEHARLISFYTMARTKRDARLIRVMAVDGNYPLYGGFSLEKKSPVTAIEENPGVFMTRETSRFLGMDPRYPDNFSLKLGSKDFTFEDFFTVDPASSLTTVDLAPRVYIGIDQLKDTGLMGFGSRIRHSDFFRLGKDDDIPAMVRNLRREFERAYPGQLRVNIYDSRNVNQSLSRMSGYFTGYMGLVSVISLFLAGVAAAYLFRGYLNLRQYEIAVMMSLGARHRDIWLYISSQLIILGTLSSGLALFISRLLIPAFPVIFHGLIPDHVVLRTGPETIILALGLGIIGSQFFCLPVFMRIFSIKPLMLLDRSSTGLRRDRRRKLTGTLALLPGGSAFLMLSIYISGSYKNGVIFTAGFFAALIFLYLAGWLLISSCRILSDSPSTVIKIPLRNIYRNKRATLLSFVTIAMGSFLISIIPQIQNGLQTEITRPRELKIPVFFLVDIQEDQKTLFQELMERENARIVNLSPMVRGRIITRNGLPFHRAGSDPAGSRGPGRRLEYNFSYRRDLDVSETVVSGEPLSSEPWSYESASPFEISVEQSFAGRNSIEIGDLLVFNVQGISLEGKVKNFRKVRWNSFKPNFFLLFQNGVLNDAPKTFLGAVSGVPASKRQGLKNKIVESFPNISVIDVTSMAGTILGITDRLSLSIGFMAWLALGTGLISIFSIARHEAFENENHINLLKVLGATFSQIRIITIIEFGFTGFTAASFAVFLSYGFSWGLSWYLFDNLWSMAPGLSILIILMTTSVCILTALAASGKVINSKPVRLLGQL